ncbi:2-octaprenyl-6-methoxyphenyl hydroxylase [Pseudoalteromonas peptidolytica]|uniref:2-octaprenyl-6-methoxyphenol hydroxylase n=1 Tax=Pseudoalteromonas peptidolytica F12-50-A1 TaxID=1315280 RepID=A0A8I0MZ12_9GAMM|nr:2-octaprenyl-6-methoxyphenyl hydroxylase [Pseudoalteromonas peptidolytica]MBE0347609.1 2-octaprenyl-6-methoxyphenol hydroxylase [Pseudoalteromonas peptidolytica F12-50-A1]NLR17005.1 2-octaprenyl-6-methoxyphenyl hydroxylase [Pseudoalteromonas peptidolytica]GEK09944.1 2-octaprenyl-6-methoxyphenyl hydroxylase [Pseudoalteromonas peptidolytica]
MQQFDVVVVGGGMAGASAAIAMKKASPQANIAVIEAFAPKGKQHPSFDDRSIALAAQSVAFLGKLNLFNPQWQYVEPITQVNVSDRGHFGKAWIRPEDYGEQALGYVVEVNPYGSFLHEQLAGLNVTLFCPNQVTEITQCPEQVVLTLDNGEQVCGRLLVVADGANSPTRTKLNIGFDSIGYEQGALIANVQIDSAHGGQAFERFTEHGPMALLPMSDNRYSLVWCMPNDKLNEFEAMAPVEFLQALQQAFGYRAGRFVQVGMRASYPLVLGRVEQLTHHRVVVIGNAAHAIHPIAGQGFNLGLRDIQVLTAQCQAVAPDEWGSFQFTRAYQLARAQDINTVMTLTDALVRLFSNSSRTLALGRSLGLLTMALSKTARAPLAKQLMGYKG